MQQIPDPLPQGATLADISLLTTTTQLLLHAGPWGYWSTVAFQQIASIGNNVTIQIVAGQAAKVGFIVGARQNEPQSQPDPFPTHTGPDAAAAAHLLPLLMLFGVCVHPTGNLQGLPP